MEETNNESIEKKLAYLNETKGLIKSAIINKGQEITDETPFRDYVQKIDNIETGVDTSDATATSDDIVKNKTAYVNGEKVTGNLKDYRTSGEEAVVDYQISVEKNEPAAGYGNPTLEIVGQSMSNGVIGLGAQVRAKADYNNVATAIALTPEKIVKGNTILGIEGTTEAGVGDVPVKLFKTVEALNADETIKENDLAIVYDGKFEDLENGGTAMYAYFPKTVVLETPITESISINFSSGNGNIDTTSMYLYDYNNHFNISYSSEDGITYTGGSSSVINIKGYTFSCSREDIIPAFIKTSTLNFEGIYKATTHKSNYVYNIANYSSLDSSNKFTYIYTGEYADKLVLRDALLTAKKRWPSFDVFCFYLDEDKNIYIARPANDNGTYPNGSYWCGFNSDGTPFKGVITNVGSKLEIYKYLPNTSTLELFTTAEKTSTYSSYMSFATSNAATLIMMRLCT